jgi:integrase
MNSQTANAALKRIGYGGKLVAHGLRSIASTAMNEAGFNADVIEAALAHSDKNEVEELIIAQHILAKNRINELVG